MAALYRYRLVSALKESPPVMLAILDHSNRVFPNMTTNSPKAFLERLCRDQNASGWTWTTRLILCDLVPDRLAAVVPAGTGQDH